MKIKHDNLKSTMYKRYWDKKAQQPKKYEIKNEKKARQPKKHDHQKSTK